MEKPYDYTQEDHIREVERVLMYIEEAERKAQEIATALVKDGAEERLVDGLRTAATALRAEHNRLLNRTHFPVPDDPSATAGPLAEGSQTLPGIEDGDEQRAAADQQRLTI
ncbi:MAG: hypothetical protein ACRDLO_06505 [Solirubrobacterales bacterium]